MRLRTTALVAALAVLGSAVLIAYGALRHGEPPKRPWRELILVAPHPEDDLLVGAELALEVLRAGGQVRVLYVFDAGTPADPGRAARRRTEVTRAWALAGLPATALTFFDLPSSGEHDGPSKDALARGLEVKRRLRQVLKGATRGALVHMPADAEDNQEALYTRRLSLEAYQLSGRPDLVLLESPFAHPFLSVVQAPERAVPWVLEQIPGLGRLLSKQLKHAAFPGFAWGRAGFFLAADPARAALRRRMLQQVTSDAGNLAQRFDGPCRYRTIIEAKLTQDRPYLGFVPMSGQLVGFSVLLLALGVGVLAFTLGATLIRAIQLALGKHASARSLRAISAALSLGTLASAALGLGGQPLRPYWLVALALGLWLSAPDLEDEASPPHP